MVVLLALAIITAPDNLGRGIDLYSRLKYERALSVLTQALEDPQVNREQAYMYIGLCRLQLGDDSGGRAAFREVLAVNPEAQLPSASSPKIVAVFADEQRKARATLPAASPPQVVSSPPVESGPALTPTTGVAPPAAPGIGAKLTRWPVLVLGGVAVGALITGTVFAVRSSGRDHDARDAVFGAEAQRLHDAAKADAHRANVAFVTAGVAAAFGLTYGFVF